MRSRLRAFPISVFTHSLFMLFGERISSSFSYIRIASSICSCNFFPALHVVRREPAADAFVLQVRVQAVGKLLVFGGIADEAGIELKGASR